VLSSVNTFKIKSNLIGLPIEHKGFCNMGDYRNIDYLKILLNLKNKIMEEQLKVGDLVKLKSGGPLMTIQGYITVRGGRLIKCAWFIDNEAKSENFAPAALLKQN